MSCQFYCQSEDERIGIRTFRTRKSSPFLQMDPKIKSTCSLRIECCSMCKLDICTTRAQCHFAFRGCVNSFLVPLHMERQENIYQHSKEQRNKTMTGFPLVNHPKLLRLLAYMVAVINWVSTPCK